MCVRELLELQSGPARDQRATKYLILALIVEFIHGIPYLEINWQYCSTIPSINNAVANGNTYYYTIK